MTNIGAVINATQNIFVNTLNATDNKSGNTYNQNCWGDWSGVGTYAVGGAGGNIDANPSNSCGMDLTPNTIVYNCAGNFEFDVNIGDGVTALDAANVWMTYPADLSVASVNPLDGNFFVAYTQSTNILNTRDTLKVNLGVLTGVTNGPDGLFKVAMNGSVSCLSGDIEMIYLDLARQHELADCCADGHADRLPVELCESDHRCQFAGDGRILQYESGPESDGR